VKNVLVKANVNLPELRRGQTGRLKNDARVAGLIASGRLQLAGASALPEQPPVGTISEVMRWVGDDKRRAERALNRELASTAARTTLVKKLQELLEETLPELASEPQEAPEYEATGEGSSLLSEHLSASEGI